MSDNTFVINFDNFIEDTYPEMSEDNRANLSNWLYWKFESDDIWEAIQGWCDEGVRRLDIPEEQAEVA